MGTNSFSHYFGPATIVTQKNSGDQKCSAHCPRSPHRKPKNSELKRLSRLNLHEIGSIFTNKVRRDVPPLLSVVVARNFETPFLKILLFNTF